MKKKQWVKPACTKVRLVPEEAVLVGCKNPGHGSTCDPKGWPTGKTIAS